MRYLRLLVAVAATIFMLGATSYCQINWMSPLRDEGVSIEASFIKSVNNLDYSSTSTAYSLSARYWPFSKFGLVMELPCAHTGEGESAAAEYFGPHAFGWTIGNPFVGLEFKTVSNSIAVVIGGRIPLADKKRIRGVHFDTLAALDRPEAFIPEMATLQLIIAYRSTTRVHLRPRIAAGSSILIPKGASAKAFVNYSAELWYVGEKLDFGLGLAGRCWLPVDGRTLDQRTTHQIGAGIGARVGGLRPGLHFRFPLDKISREYINEVYGVDITVRLQ